MNFIIFGTKYLNTKVRGGIKTIGHCSKCKQSRELFEYERKKYFSLFFIPLIPLGDENRFLRCEKCDLNYEITDNLIIAEEINITCPSCKHVWHIPSLDKDETEVQCIICQHEFIIRKRVK